MRLFPLLGTGMLTLLLGVPAALYAQDEPKQQQEEKTEPRQDEAKPKEQKEAKPSKQDEKAAKQQQESNRSGQEMNANGHGAAASGKSGGRIPDDKFRSHFGRSHTVVINQPTIVEGEPRFQSGGYWFNITQPWPAGWAYSDPCYIDYVDGEYVLFDLNHPGVSIVLMVVL